MIVTLQGTNISHQKSLLKMIFLFPRWDMLIPWRVPVASSCHHLSIPGFLAECQVWINRGRSARWQWISGSETKLSVKSYPGKLSLVISTPYLKPQRIRAFWDHSHSHTQFLLKSPNMVILETLRDQMSSVQMNVRF